MKTHGEIEAAISEGIGRFEQDYMGRGPKDIHAHLLGDLLVVRLQGVLTAEQHFFAAYLNCAASVDLNCPTAWKEEDGFLLPSSGFRM